MATIKSYSDLEQSKKLAEILPLESADMCYQLPCEEGDKPLLEQGGFGSTPCWSLASLLDILPNASILLKGFDKIYDLTNSSGEIAKADNPVDACVEIIIKLNELNLL